MATLAAAHATAAATQLYDAKKVGESMNALAMATATIAEIVWPTRLFLGCARGERTVLKSSTALAPRLAMMVGGFHLVMPGA